MINKNVFLIFLQVNSYFIVRGTFDLLLNFLGGF